MKNCILTLLIISIINGYSFGQSITPAIVNISGGSYSQGYYHISWNVGELALVNQLQAADGSCFTTNGLIQPFTEHLQPNFNNRFTSEEIRILPNPTRNILEVDYLSLMKGRVVFTLYDAVGRAVYTKALTSNGNGFIEKINMIPLPSGAYMLHIVTYSSDGSGLQKTGSYKILKINSRY